MEPAFDAVKRKVGEGGSGNGPYSDTWLKRASRGPVNPAKLLKILSKSWQSHHGLPYVPGSCDRSVAVGMDQPVEKLSRCHSEDHSRPVHTSVQTKILLNPMHYGRHLSPVGSRSAFFNRLGRYRTLCIG